MLCAGSGGWAMPDDPTAEKQGLSNMQLYDLEADPGEQKNLHAEHPEIVRRLTTLLEKQVAEGRTRTRSEERRNYRSVEEIEVMRPQAGKPGNAVVSKKGQCLFDIRHPFPSPDWGRLMKLSQRTFQDHLVVAWGDKRSYVAVIRIVASWCKSNR